jgi:hypothetical protein
MRISGFFFFVLFLRFASNLQATVALGRRRLGAERKLFFTRVARFGRFSANFLRDGMLFPLFTVHHKEAL